MYGLEVLAQARALREHLKAVVMTGSQSPLSAVTALRYRICDLLYKPFLVIELRLAIRTALSSHHLCAPIEVLSAKPEWLELLIPCDLGVVQPLYRIFTQLELDLPPEAREAMSVAFRELLQNAIEHGGKCDPSQRVTVSYTRFKRAILCSIKDPGGGFKLEELGHAAVSNPGDAPYHHLAVRDQQGLRPGGFGILLAHQLVDELSYNDCRNQVVFAKYLRA
jgi:anti-sigma regulatory factor (Ser/Thr protein kinase)